MSIKNSESMAFKIILRIKNELQDIEAMDSAREIKGKILDVLKFIDEDVFESKKMLLDVIHDKIKETRDRKPDLNTQLYILYRNLAEEKITPEEAQKLYEMYIMEY
jgi:hypothetical protein